MRLLMATAESFPTHRPDVAVLFGRALPARGISCDLVAAPAPGAPAGARWEGGEALLSAGGGGRVVRFVRAFLHGASRLLRADPARYAALQVRDMPLLALVGLLAARWKGLPFYYWMSFPYPESQLKGAAERGLSEGPFWFLFPWLRGHAGRFLLYALVLPRADHVFVQSERMREDVAARGVPRERMTPVPMGVDLESARPESVAPSEDPWLEGKRALVYLGTMDPLRRIDVLFDMLALLRKEFPDVVLVLAGSAGGGAHERRLREHAAGAGVADAVLWTGFLPAAEAWRYVRAAALGLSPIPRGPILDCGSPTKCLEYLALGVPVVGNDNPDQKAVLVESGGGACVPLEPEAFAAAAARLLKDPPRAAAMAAAGRAYVRERRGYDSISKGLAEVYVRLHESYNTRPMGAQTPQ